MKKTAILVILSVTILGLFSGCSTYYAFNSMIPENESYGPDEIATLVIAYPLKPNTIDGVKIEEIGGNDTVIEILPGEHELVFHMDTANDWTDKLETSTTYETIMTSGIITENIMTYPGQIHFYRVVKKSYDEFWTGITYGPNPFQAPDGTRILFDPMENTVKVRRNGEESEFDLNSKLVFYSWNAKHLSFITYENKKWLIVIDGVRSKPIDGLLAIGGVWSIDGSQFAYAGFLKQTMFKSDLYIFINDRKIGPVQTVDSAAPFFFDIQGRFICSAQKDDTWYMLRGDEKIAMESQYDAMQAVFGEWDNFVASFQDSDR